MHIHPSSPNSDISLQSEESAAIKIQAGFRGYRVRKQLTGRPHSRNTSNGYQGLNSILRRQQRHQQSGMSQNQSAGSNGVTSVPAQLRQERSGESESASVEDRCATKIQAGVRGFLVRKKQKAAADAATKIQAGFRGFKARKEVQKIKQK
ncbi:hypothetical protein FF38_01855 [Lucilia cuprina]|uniref:Abnormal spindle-like microcephaly-associated protein n=1 Tax=Lucilia cuprina TaxID=7375 RepID=A0A0L0BQ93_LUCCU|nr:Abnormal spindle-like microcephaly-associated protein like protein [Lucilia cuprina]KNC22181.1 hypothetical protein FF38_01855 [Lucilia cuprina]